MGRFNVEPMRHMEKEHFRVLLAIEMGMKNHEAVPLQLISIIASIYRGGCAHLLRDLNKMKLVYHEKGRKFDGYRLTTLGYDYLALHTLRSRGVVGAVGNQIGVGKESDVYVGGDADLADIVLKFSRLGRTSFRKLKEKRDYHGKRQHCSWLYLSRISALKEFTFLKALYNAGFPVPKPIDVCRHTVVMSLIDGVPLYKMMELENPGELYDELMGLIVKFAEYGLIHGDFNEFNIMMTEEMKVYIIDFPQMTSTDHPNAQFYFERDVECIREFFRKKFKYESEDFPTFDQVERRFSMDVELAATGFTKKMAADINKAYEDRCNMTKGELDEVIEEESSEVDEEELEEEEENAKLRRSELAAASRFTTWLEDAQSQISGMKIEEDFDVTDKQMKENYEKHVKEQEVKKILIEEGEDQGNGDEKEDNPSEFGTDVYELKRGKVTSSRKVFEDGSTIAPEDIRKRLLTEKQKSKREKFKAKGKESAVRRGRKTNQNIVKEYDGWDF
ncbi:unnamed protein product [Bursaphelenchus xylophilus]|uniref:Serine/threonine-protein kinase RIO2 n=1 Tax=Bursaphelenchus xylophilus TaxID=6326 RepID=A0A1I7S8S0_BURXY|nr:unnamed protein product [Bursaphelenchus xylophilus]CAG9085775.1 unnamed protein product [Bursaphelenchus xylophilus]